MFRWLLVPLIGAFIGWFTNVLAIRLLFRPLRPWSFLGWTLQGLIPRRRQEIASSVAEVIDKELLPWREIVQGLYRPEIEARLTEAVVQVAGRRFIERLPSFLPPKVKETIARLLENSLRQELPAALRELEELLLSSRGINFSLGKLAARKINSLDLEQAEKIILQVASRELRYIELVGGVLGFLIGLVQAALLR